MALLKRQGLTQSGHSYGILHTACMYFEFPLSRNNRFNQYIIILQSSFTGKKLPSIRDNLVT